VRYPGAKYHVTSRGNGRARIFLCQSDYQRFLDQLAAALEADGVILYSYALLSNHIHLHLETPRGNLPRFMQRLTTAYGMYFRYKKSRPGHCFQGRYGAKVVEGDDYHLRITRYIHLNPVKTRAMATVPSEERLSQLETYPWSSYRSYVGLAPPEEILDYRWLELMGRTTAGGNQRAYRRYVNGFVVDEDDILTETMKASRYAIGDERFRERTEEGVLGVRLHKADDGDIVWPGANGVAVEYVLAVVAAHFKVSEDDLRFHGRRLGMIKAVAIELCCRFSGQTQREIARLFGYRDSSSVGKRRQALAAHLVEAPALRGHIAKLEKKITALKS
jgi:REP element-mobilizing transposase RayT